MKLPERIKYWTADEIAECLSVGDAAYRELWRITSEAADKKPLGGDGTNGTHEWPEVTEHHGNQPKVFWATLSEEIQQAIINAVAQAIEEGDLL